LSPGTVLFYFGCWAVLAFFLQTYFRRGFSVVTKCCKRKDDAEVYADDEVFRDSKGHLVDLAEYKDKGAAVMLSKYKLVQHLPPLSNAFKDYQKKSILKEYIISTYTLGMEKNVTNHTIGLVSEEQEFTEKEKKDKRTLKEYFSYDILLDPFYSTKFSYYPGYVPGRLALISIPEFDE